MHIHRRRHIHKQTHTHTHTCMHACMHTNIHTYICLCVIVRGLRREHKRNIYYTLRDLGTAAMPVGSRFFSSSCLSRVQVYHLRMLMTHRAWSPMVPNPVLGGISRCTHWWCSPPTMPASSPASGTKRVARPGLKAISQKTIRQPSSVGMEFHLGQLGKLVRCMSACQM